MGLEQATKERERGGEREKKEIAVLLMFLHKSPTTRVRIVTHFDITLLKQRRKSQHTDTHIHMAILFLLMVILLKRKFL